MLVCMMLGMLIAGSVYVRAPGGLQSGARLQKRLAAGSVARVENVLSRCAAFRTVSLNPSLHRAANLTRIFRHRTLCAVSDTKALSASHLFVAAGPQRSRDESSRRGQCITGWLGRSPGRGDHPVAVRGGDRRGRRGMPGNSLTRYGVFLYDNAPWANPLAQLPPSVGGGRTYWRLQIFLPNARRWTANRSAWWVYRWADISLSMLSTSAQIGLPPSGWMASKRSSNQRLPRR